MGIVHSIKKFALIWNYNNFLTSYSRINNISVLFVWIKVHSFEWENENRLRELIVFNAINE